MLERYIRGLRQSGLARRLVQEKVPQTVDEAILAVEGFTVQEERLKRMMDTKTPESTSEEKMEVGEVAPQKTSAPPTLPNTSMETLNTSVSALSRQLQGLHKEMAKLKGQTLCVSPPSTPALQTVWVEHRSTTPARPQSNGKIERFHLRIKEMLNKLVNGDRPQWENSHMPLRLTEMPFPQ